MEKQHVKKMLGYALLLLGTTYLSSCKEEYDLEDLSTENLAIVTALDAPIAKMELSMKDVFLHRGSGGHLVTADSTYDLRYIYSEEKIPLPNDIIAGTDITAQDTLKDVNFEEYIGQGNIVDSLEAINLKLKVTNELPFKVNAELRFLEDAYEFNTNHIEGVTQEIPSLRRSFTIDGCAVNPTTKLMSQSSEATVSLKFSGQDNEALRRVNYIVIVYTMAMGSDIFRLEKESAIKLNMSAYIKAKIRNKE